MNVPRPLEFPEMTSTQINVALVADKLNEVIRFLKDNYPDENAFSVPQLKPGVTRNKRGIYMKDGKFIKKEEAFL